MANPSDKQPPTWHFSWLAPIYDWFSPKRDYDRILPKLDLQPDCRFLDLGGGTGEFSRHLVNEGLLKNKNIFVADLNEAMLLQARVKNLRNLIRSSSTSIPILDGTISRVFMGDTLHHMPDPGTVLSQVWTILEDDGLLVIEEFNPRKIWGKLTEILENATGMNSDFFPPDRLTSLLENSGFEEITIDEDGFVYFVTARKVGTK